VKCNSSAFDFVLIVLNFRFISRVVGVFVDEKVSVYSAFLVNCCFGISYLAVFWRNIHRVQDKFSNRQKGVVLRFEGAGYRVIQNAEEWDEICRKCFPPDVVPPEINFSNTTVIAVFMGECPTSGFDVEVKEITDTIFRVIVKVAWMTYTGKAVAQVFTSPFHIIKVQKINKPMTFQTVWETEDC
jgi:hypothetical protein